MPLFPTDDRPTEDPLWATTPDAGDLLAPAPAKQALGWQSNGGGPATDEPPLNWFNWWQNLVYKWVKYFDNRLWGRSQYQMLLFGGDDSGGSEGTDTFNYDEVHYISSIGIQERIVSGGLTGLPSGAQVFIFVNAGTGGVQASTSPIGAYLGGLPLFVCAVIGGLIQVGSLVDLRRLRRGFAETMDVTIGNPASGADFTDLHEALEYITNAQQTNFKHTLRIVGQVSVTNGPINAVKFPPGLVIESVGGDIHPDSAEYITWSHDGPLIDVTTAGDLEDVTFRGVGFLKFAGGAPGPDDVLIRVAQNAKIKRVHFDRCHSNDGPTFIPRLAGIYKFDGSMGNSVDVEDCSIVNCDFQTTDNVIAGGGYLNLFNLRVLHSSFKRIGTSVGGGAQQDAIEISSPGLQTGGINIHDNRFYGYQGGGILWDGQGAVTENWFLQQGDGVSVLSVIRHFGTGVANFGIIRCNHLFGVIAAAGSALIRVNIDCIVEKNQIAGLATTIANGIQVDGNDCVVDGNKIDNFGPGVDAINHLGNSGTVGVNQISACTNAFNGAGAAGGNRSVACNHWGGGFAVLTGTDAVAANHA